MERELIQKEWYEQYHSRTGGYRNNLRANPEVLFQTLAIESSIVRAVRKISNDPSNAKVLNVGCGSGGDTYQLLRLGYSPDNLTGIEIQKKRLERAKKVFPNVKWIHGDATKMDFSDNHFDVIFESTMFATLPDDSDRHKIASEMIRVCKPEGYLLLVDWRTPKIGDRNYKALTRGELRKLFNLNTSTSLIYVTRGALIPPIGRFLSKYASSFYFLLSAICPFLVGQVVYVIKKNHDN